MIYSFNLLSKNYPAFIFTHKPAICNFLSYLRLTHLHSSWRQFICFCQTIDHFIFSFFFLNLYLYIHIHTPSLSLSVLACKQQKGKNRNAKKKFQLTGWVASPEQLSTMNVSLLTSFVQTSSGSWCRSNDCWGRIEVSFWHDQTKLRQLLTRRATYCDREIKLGSVFSSLLFYY